MAPVVELEGITKSFGPSRVLHGVGLVCKAGETQALLGANGAGKSTLIQILTGVYRPNAGTVRVDGQEVSFRRPLDAERAGISAVYQELSVIEDLDVAENIFLHREPRRHWGRLDRAALYERCAEVLERLGIDLDPRASVSSLSVARRQLVELAKALARDARLVILDEPTASLTATEQARLFETLDDLRSRGVAVLYVSHRLEEVFRVADRVTVLRDGRLVWSVPVGETSKAGIVEAMVGQELDTQRPAGRGLPPDRPATLRVAGFSSPGHFRDVDIEVRHGEIVGLAGLVGSGRSSLLRALFGADRAAEGTVELDGEPLRIRSVQDAVRQGLALIGEDRKRDGLALDLQVLANLGAARLPSKAGLYRPRAGRRLARAAADKVSLRYGLDHEVRMLSGGNQQKVVVGKWIAAAPRVLLCDEPTRGIDVGARSEIYALLREIAAEGVAVLVASSDLDEILALTDRVYVMSQGAVRAEVVTADATEASLMDAALGGHSDPAVTASGTRDG